MEDDLDLGDSTIAEGGVGNGQATGTGHVSDDFDMDSAVDGLSDSLGFGKSDDKNVLDVPAVEKKEAPQVEAPAPKVDTPAPQDVAPKTWKAEEAAVWASIPPAAKAAIARREEDMFRGIEQHKATAAFGNTVQAVLDPYMPILKAHNMDPVQNIKFLMNAHYQLATGSNDQKVQMMNQLLKDYNIDFKPAEVDPYAPLPDPEVLLLRQKIEALESGQARVQQQAYQEAQAKTGAEVVAFAEDKANIYFDEVADDIVSLVKADQTLTLKDAYEKAIWLNPVVREKELARRDAEKQTKLREESAKQVANARRGTAANLQVQPKAGAATLPLGTMDDTMAETMASIKNR